MKKSPNKVAAKKSSFKDHLTRYVARFSFGGLALATVFFCLSFLPSLLPRPALYQGLISGFSFAIGYGIGAGLSRGAQWLIEWRPSPVLHKRLWIALGIIGPVAAVVYLILGGIWQNDVRQLIGEKPEGGEHVFTVLTIAFITWILLLSIARGLRTLTAFCIRQIDRLLPRRLSIALGVFLISYLCFWVVSGLFVDFFVKVSNNIYSTKNASTPAGVNQPTSPYRSGSPASYVPWQSLGYQGKAFVGRGPNQKQLADYTGEAPTEQIRVYVGLESANSPTARAQLAVKELKRTGAFSRPVLILATATGTGWLEPQSVDSLEYMYGGNSAIVSQQYSYLPSWISFLVDKENAIDAGQALFDAVYGEWASLPQESRPKLIAYGLSLGSFGGQAPYAGANALSAMVDGALFMGTPNDTQLWRTITSDRESGSPEWQPVYDNGETVRFAATNQDIGQNQEKWQMPRMLYMQHASDPVVWFSFNLINQKPDWLKEPRGPDVSPATRWYPFITFMQVTVDQFFGVTVPNGHGHNYGNTIVNSWGAVVPPAGWNAEKAAKLQTIINTYSNE